MSVSAVDAGKGEVWMQGDQQYLASHDRSDPVLVAGGVASQL